MRNDRTIDPEPFTNARIGVVRGDTVTFKATLTPVTTLLDNQYSWTGEKTGDGPTIDVQFNTAGNRMEKLAVLGCTRKANIVVVDVPPPNENAWARSYIFVDFTVPITANQLAAEAQQWAAANQASLGGGLHNGKADAARHAYWNVLMGIDLTVTIAAQAATAHERSNIEANSPHNETAMDMLNNAVGRGLVAGLPANPTRANAQTAVTGALNAGSLTVLNPPNNTGDSGLLAPSN